MPYRLPIAVQVAKPSLVSPAAPVPPIIGADDAEALHAAMGNGVTLVEGHARDALSTLPDDSVDSVVTSPPYWSVRKYDGVSELGQERRPSEYVAALLTEIEELPRVLKPGGSFWLNIGDTYMQKNLCGIPWRIAIALQDEGWILRNAVVWDKVKGNPDNAKDKLRDLYEMVFHFVRDTSYFYDIDAVRSSPKPPVVRDGKIVTATGVSGVKYRRQIQRSTVLSEQEKDAALRALDDALGKVADGSLPDFRMIIRGQQRTTHSDATEFSGRATEIKKRGYCILPYHKKGSKPGDVWQIVPEDRWRIDSHCAVFPEELCRIPVLATCPIGGTVLDPFSGTGTALKVAQDYSRAGIGIDTSRDYLKIAQIRIAEAATIGDRVDRPAGD